MNTIRKELVSAAINKAYSLTDLNIHNNIDKQHRFLQKSILSNKSLTNDEKFYAIKSLSKSYDYNKILYNEGTKRICEVCHDECLATLYCEHCVRNYLKSKFSNWSSGNDDIDNLIQKCQMETLRPDKIVEWIPYDNLQNINYLTKGGCTEIYTADWFDGRYDEWDSKVNQLKRSGKQIVILKKLENVENANKSWFEESKSHITISNKYGQIVKCYGITQDPSDRNYMLVTNKMDMDLRSYLQQNHNDLTWKERTQIAYEIIFSTSRIHQENAIHKHLHSGNILFSKIFKISDFGFCGPADKPLDSIYGNLPYMAPEVIAKKEYTSASDIYSIGLLMWEITSGQPPFAIKHNDELAMRIVNGMRPKIIPGTPTEYKKLMKQCWDANPTKRPNMKDLLNRIRKIKSYYQYKDNNEPQPDNTSSQLSSKSTDSFFYSFKSKVYNFKDLPEPRNATIKEEQEGYRCIQFDFDLQNENKSKRILDNDKKDKSKKVKFNDNEEIRIIEDTDNEIGCQQNYTDDPNFYSEEQRISDDKMDLNFLLN